ncbi:unnamed protein product, partial [marine sediment metagenome]
RMRLEVTFFLFLLGERRPGDRLVTRDGGEDGIIYFQ